MTLETCPLPDELEVSVFGPGVGECVVVHIGGGEWIVVDSCIEASTRTPAALTYLRALNVDVAQAVKLVVVTHWHDDHMRGASAIAKEAHSARFVCSAALNADEFKTFIAASQTLNTKTRNASGVDEFAAILALLQERRGRARAQSVGPVWTSADQLLYRRAASGAVAEAELFALSPSASALSRGFHDIASVMPKRGMPKRAAVSVEPNETSVVLSVRLGEAHALLGSDLENGSTSTVGWRAVLTTASRPQVRAQIFKVPHHGSSNAHLDEVWTSALTSDVVAVLTPFARGRRPLPSPADTKRLKGLTRSVYIAARGAASKVSLPDPMVQRTVREATRDFRARSGKMGHVRVRIASDSPVPTVEIFGAAFAA
jgi:hypothetical protein